MFRTQTAVWFLGALLGGCAAIGAFWHLRPEPEAIDPGPVGIYPADDAAPADELTLPEAERAYLWSIEHGGNLLMKHGFGPLAAALRRGDATAIQPLFSDDFQGQTLYNPREVASHGDWLTVVRQMDAGHPPLSLDRRQFADLLLDYRRLFHTEPKVKISLMKLAPIRRGDLDSPWRGTCQLRMSGEKATGQPAEVVAYLNYQLPRPTEERLKAGGWLQACAVDQSQVGSAAHFLLRNVTAEAGIDVAALSDRWKSSSRRDVSGGVYLCDFDRDGLVDMLITDFNGYWLYKGLPGGKFRDVTAEMGLPKHPPLAEYAPPAAFIDIDGDGWEDLILGQSVYRNEGGQRFTNVTGRCNLGLPLDAVGFAVADFDRDGHLDLYVVRNGNGKTDSWLEGKAGRAAGNRLWRNTGKDWQFEEVTEKAGADGGRRSTFTAIWFDANNDGWPDLYVPNEFGSGVLLVNQGNGTFREQALTAVPSDFGTMGVTAGDIDNDGNIDLYSSNMYSKAGKRVIGNLRPDAYAPDVMARLRTLVEGSQLHHNLGGLKFEQKAQEWQVADCGWAYGAALADLDNDGWLDLCATAGYMSNDRTKPDG